MNASQRPRINPYIAVVLATLSISTSAIWVRLADAPAAVTAFYRLFFSTLFMAPFLYKHIGEFRSMTRKSVLWCALAGICLAFHFILWFQSLAYTSVASSVVLVTIQPIFAFAGSVLFFKTRLRLYAVVGALCAISGSVLIGWGDFGTSRAALYGDVLALVACLLITVYLMVGQEVRKDMELYAYTLLVYAFAALALFLFVLVSRQALFNHAPKDWLMFLLLAVFPTLLGHSVYNWSVKWVGVNTLSMTILGEPVGSSILAYIFFGETLGPLQLAGSLVILTGIFLYLMGESKTKARKKPSALSSSTQT
ncbi:DMT family transporter [Caenibacillus caldisaponilyticus]|uniref:DMT family transporter n=1 Tax=Caenibacillus caldisaponilyticus TaxID=1674942 RepID=UPI001873854D|nr:DMT family transporter [Caenibacillus caldisaponilyticus]